MSGTAVSICLLALLCASSQGHRGEVSTRTPGVGEIVTWRARPSTGPGELSWTRAEWPAAVAVLSQSLRRDEEGRVVAEIRFCADSVGPLRFEPPSVWLGPPAGLPGHEIRFQAEELDVHSSASSATPRFGDLLPLPRRSSFTRLDLALAAFSAAAGVLLGLLLRWRRREELQSPWERACRRALAALARVGGSRDSSEAGRAAHQVSRILRSYWRDGFEVPALRLSQQELQALPPRLPAPLKPCFERTLELLVELDRVRFSRWREGGALPAFPGEAALVVSAATRAAEQLPGDRA